MQSKLTSSERKKRLREAVEAVKTEPRRKQRLIWTKDLHARFLAVMTVLGTSAKPKHILHTMNVQGLTRQSVASHLQKYRSQCRNYAAPSNSAVCSLPFGADGYGMWTWVDEGGSDASVNIPGPFMQPGFARLHPGPDRGQAMTSTAAVGPGGQGNSLRYHPYDVTGGQAGRSSDGARRRDGTPATGTSGGAPVNHPGYTSAPVLSNHTAGWDTSALASTQGAPGNSGNTGGHTSSASNYTMSAPATTSGHPLGGPQALQRM
eukprot:TRINITY_DN2098_c0_g3_i1.p1 TRINITY_DN2098_c0_g3~~TRINITY_DN2098_c0_g3_i1.p1  ORF type:complete len:262 (-),score=17.56 TRINITY_DN2098_c0_g3_i1:343-1128(-)